MKKIARRYPNKVFILIWYIYAAICTTAERREYTALTFVGFACLVGKKERVMENITSPIANLPAYEPPVVVTYTDEEILEALGPAQAVNPYALPDEGLLP